MVRQLQFGGIRDQRLSKYCGVMRFDEKGTLVQVSALGYDRPEGLG